MMREKDRLRALQVRVAGDEHFQVILTQFNQRALQVVNLVGELANLLAQPHARVERYLIVA